MGTASTGLSELVSNPLGSLAATITAPFVQWSQAHFATALARTQYDEAVLRFEKALWQALSDVDNALSARTQVKEEGAALARALAAARTTERLTEIRYRVGAVSLSAYLATQQSRRTADLALSSNRLAQLENYRHPLPSPGRQNCLDKRLSGSSGVGAVTGTDIAGTLRFPPLATSTDAELVRCRQCKSRRVTAESMSSCFLQPASAFFSFASLDLATRRAP